MKFNPKVADCLARITDSMRPLPLEPHDAQAARTYAGQVLPSVRNAQDVDAPFPLRLHRDTYALDERQGFTLFVGVVPLRRYSPDGFARAFEDMEMIRKVLETAGIRMRVRVDAPVNSREGGYNAQA